MQDDGLEDEISGEQETDRAEEEDVGKEQERIEAVAPLIHLEETTITHEGATADPSLSLSDESLNTITDRTVDKLLSERMEHENVVVTPTSPEVEIKSDDSNNAPLAQLKKCHTEKQSKKRKVSADSPGPSKKRSKQVLSKKKHKPKKSKSRKRKVTPSPVTAEEAMDVTHFDDAAELFEYDILVNRKLVPEARFTDPLHKDVGFLTFVRMKESPWFHRAFVRGKMIELSPKVINNLLKLPTDNPEVFPYALIRESRREVALRLSVWKSDNFGRSGLAATELTMKFQCLFCFCAMNVFPTSNWTNIGYEMGKLLLCIDKFCADINFGFVVISRMMKYARGKSFDKTNLPYPALITLLLKENGILPEPTEDVIHTTFFKPRSNLHKLFNDFKEPLPADPSGQLLEARRLLLEVLQEQASIRSTLGEH
ncbi:uncharacterized protein LOC127266271 [Andrographis paniculata]|uniref:uncharacterized protein LOC127266271 n=1 Tax=Andrographis paniculata TaxID=175694 RepID=UPI0021E7F135|nr:uncharacterized protein LOC127266271 [Andrographis paniculata]